MNDIKRSVRLIEFFTLLCCGSFALLLLVQQRRKNATQDITRLIRCQNMAATTSSFVWPKHCQLMLHSGYCSGK